MKKIRYVDKNAIIILILVLQNLSIFFADIVHYITVIQFICLFAYLLYMILYSVKLKVYSEIRIWILYCAVVFLNILIGGDKDYIITFFICNITVLFMMSIDETCFYEIKILKVCTFIHLIFSLIVYFVPHSYIDYPFSILLGTGTSANYSWRVISNMNAGITTQPGTNACFLSILIIVCFVEFVEKKENKLFNMFCILASFLMILTTGKRSALLITFSVMVLYYLIFHHNAIRVTTRRRMLLFVVGSCCLVFLLFWVVNKSNLMQVLMLKTNQLSENGDISNGRFELWKLAWNRFKINPISGSGLKSIYKETGFDVHNTYLQILAETGIVGFLFLVTGLFQIIICGYKKIRKEFKTGRILNVNFGIGYCLLLFLVIYGLVGNTFIDYLPLMLFCMSVMMIFNKKRGRK